MAAPFNWHWTQWIMERCRPWPTSTVGGGHHFMSKPFRLFYVRKCHRALTTLSVPHSTPHPPPVSSPLLATLSSSFINTPFLFNLPSRYLPAHSLLSPIAPSLLPDCSVFLLYTVSSDENRLSRRGECDLRTRVAVKATFTKHHGRMP